MALPVTNVAPAATQPLPPRHDAAPAAPAKEPSAPFSVHGPGGPTAPGAGAPVGPTAAGGPAAAPQPAKAGISPAARVEQPREAARAESLNPFEELERHQAEVNEFLARLHTMPTEQQLPQLLLLAERGRGLAFKVELISKVVEQATGGARTILQTQA